MAEILMSTAPSPEPSSMDVLRRRISDLEESLSKQQRIQDALRGTRFSPSTSFFDLLALELAHACDADYALVGALLPDQRTVKTVGLCADGKIAPGFEYALEGTPCEDVVGKDVCSYPTGVAAQFPRDRLLQQMGVDGYCGAPLFDTSRRALGLLAVLSRKPLRDGSRAEGLLRVAAARASAELERSRAESRLRSVFDANMVGIVFWNSAGDITGANDAFLEAVRYTREDLDSGKVRWKDMTPPEYAELDARALEELRTTGTCCPFEKEYFRKDGTRVPILIGGSRVSTAPLAGVAFV